jgi:hypothetical protein
MKKTKYLLLLLVLVGMIGTIYAFWFSGINAPANNDADGDINVGSGRNVNTVLTIGDATSTQTLVPIGTLDVSQGTNLTEEIVLIFNVLWHEENNTTLATGHQGYLVVTLDRSTITLDPLVRHLVNISFTSVSAISLNVSTMLQVRVTLTMPANQAEYNLLANQSFSFTLNSSVVFEAPVDIDALFVSAQNYLNDFDNTVHFGQWAHWDSSDLTLPRLIPDLGATISWYNVSSSNIITNSFRHFEMLPRVTINDTTRDLDVVSVFEIFTTNINAANLMVSASFHFNADFGIDLSASGDISINAGIEEIHNDNNVSLNANLLVVEVINEFIFTWDITNGSLSLFSFNVGNLTLFWP